MRQRRLNAAIGVAVMSLLLAGCGLSVDDGFAGSYARLGPAESPVQLYYEDVGAGPPVLLIHGFGASTYTWRYITPELARDHRVIAVDLKGFGQSDKPFDERYSVFDQADLLAQFIEEHDLRDLTVVGHSYGGGIALLLALEANQRLGNRLAKLVLLDTIAYPQNVPVFFRMLSTPLISHLGVRMVPPSVQTRVALQIAYLDNSKIEDSEVEVYAAPLKTAAGKHAIIYSARQIMPEDLEQISERYESIELPTLILWCDHDRIVPIDVGLKLRRTLPNSSLKLVRDCGHMPQEEQPAQTLKLLKGFIGG
ncbi:MAG: alpha/beta fold hydrolase [Methyloceanibacter sp.]|uniref:alpha/beta fold hydrolase n=1 Tax=Methyloceanibacter sp. TaxID=1965321 RepID=UPI003D9BE26D